LLGHARPDRVARTGAPEIVEHDPVDAAVAHAVRHALRKSLGWERQFDASRLVELASAICLRWHETIRRVATIRLPA